MAAASDGSPPPAAAALAAALGCAAAPAPPGPRWLDEAATAATPRDAAALLQHTPTAWTSTDAATRRAAARLAALAARADDAPLATAVAAFTLPLALRALAAGDAVVGDDVTPCVDAIAALAAALAANNDAPLPPQHAAAITEAALAAAAPPDALFGDVGGDPVDEPGPGADAWSERAAACVRAAAAAAARVPPETEALLPEPEPELAPVRQRPVSVNVSELWNVAGQRDGRADGGAAPPPPRAPLIQVIGDDDDEIGASYDDEDDDESATAKQAKKAAAAATAAAAAASGRARADALLLAALYTPAPGLDGAWAGGPAADAAAEAAAAVAGESQLADAVAQTLPHALAPLHATLVQDHWRGLDAVKMTPYAGPGVFARAAAARQLAWLVQQLDAASVPSSLSAALPALLAAASDPAPAVQRGGAAALAAVAAAGPAAVAPHAAALAPAVGRAVVGCADRAWPAAAPAAVALAVALDGGANATTPPAACDGALDAWLTEGERHAHDAPRARVWAAATPPLLTRLRCTATRHYARLLPLLLEWVAGGDGACRRGAALCLSATLRAAWPRAAAHAPAVWPVLERGYREAVRDGDGDSVAAVVDAARAVVEAGRWAAPAGSALKAALD